MSSMSGGQGYRGSAGMPQQGNGAGGDIIPKGYSKGQLNQFTPEMMQVWQMIMEMMGPQSQTGRLAAGDESMFEEMEAPAMRQFNALQGQNANRFSNMGMGARRGSGFQNFQNQATSDFAQDLASKRMELRRQAIQDLQGMGNTLLQNNPQEKFLVEKPQKKRSFGQELALAAVPAAIEGAFSLGK